MVVSTHEGLLQAIAQERQQAALAAALRALQTLMGAAPYPRLPPDLLPRCLEVSTAGRIP